MSSGCVYTCVSYTYKCPAYMGFQDTTYITYKGKRNQKKANQYMVLYTYVTNTLRQI